MDPLKNTRVTSSLQELRSTCQANGITPPTGDAELVLYALWMADEMVRHPEDREAAKAWLQERQPEEATA